jgi:hypothetical protein
VINQAILNVKFGTWCWITFQSPTGARDSSSGLIIPIDHEQSVILAVSGANVDLANSEALKLARSVDPQGRRTIGILTKLDLMDAGTNALDILTGRVYQLKLGFIGVVNRSQQDIISEKTMSDALDSETEYFRNHPAYRNIAHKNGTKYLAKTLNTVRGCSYSFRDDVIDPLSGPAEPYSRKTPRHESTSEYSHWTSNTGAELLW